MAQLMAWALAQDPQALAKHEAPGVSQAVSSLAMKLALVALAHHADDHAQTFVSAQTVGEALSPSSTPGNQRNAGARAIAGLIARGLVVVVDDPGNAPRMLELLWPYRRHRVTTSNDSGSDYPQRGSQAAGAVTTSNDSGAGESDAAVITSVITDDALTSGNTTEVMKCPSEALSVTSSSSDVGVEQAYQSDKVRQLREAADQRDENARMEADREQLNADRQEVQRQDREAQQEKHRASEIRTIASVIAQASTRPGMDYQQTLTALLASADFRARCTPEMYGIISRIEHPKRQRAIDELAALVPGLIAEQVSA